MPVVADATQTTLHCAVVECTATVRRLHGADIRWNPRTLRGLAREYHSWATCRNRDKPDGIDYCPAHVPYAFDAVEVTSHWVRDLVVDTEEAP